MSSTAADDEDQPLELGDFFQEPDGFLQPPKSPTFAEHRMRSGQMLKVHMVGEHPLYVRPGTATIPRTYVLC